MSAAQQATIKRATLAAQRSMEQLDAKAIDELTAVYKQAADDIAARIAQHAGPDGNLSLQEMRSALQQVNAELARLTNARDTLLNNTIDRAAQLGVQPYQAQAAGVTAALDHGAAMKVANEAVRFVRSFVAEDGLQLSDRIWRIDSATRDGVVNAIERAVIQGQSAAQAASDLLLQGVGVPADLRKKINDANAAGISRAVKQQLIADDESGALYNAQRLMRTEINRAHGEAYMKGGEQHPDFAGWRFLLSPAHPKHDICDLLSTQNLYGLGPGVYPTRAQTPWPAHPNTLSFVVIVFKDEVTDADRAGKQTPMEALAALTPAQRLGALGRGKTEIYEAGRLKQGMIRTPLAAVRKRVGVSTPIRPAPVAPAPVPRVPVTLDEMIAAGATRVDKLLAGMRAADGDPAMRLPTLLYHDLRGERAINTAAKVAGGGAGANLVREASLRFPDQWTEAADKYGPLSARLTKGRGLYRERSGGEGEISAGNFSVAVHEYAHRLQHALPQLDDFFQELHGRRTEGDALKRLRDLQPRPRYRGDEVTREDDYIDPYQGKIYSGGARYRGRHGALEVMTMAFQTVLGQEPEMLRRMLQNDREMINLTVGLLYHHVPKL